MNVRSSESIDASVFFFKQKTAYEIGLGIPAEPLFRSKEIICLQSLKWLETNNLFNNLIQRNQSAAFSSGKVRPNHETNINIIARRTGKDVNSHTVLDGIITTIMATIQDRKSGSAGMPRPNSYAVFCLKKNSEQMTDEQRQESWARSLAVVLNGDGIPQRDRYWQIREATRHTHKLIIAGSKYS